MWQFISNFRRIFTRKSLAEEVIEVFDSAPGIKKLGHNDEEDYDFLEIVAMCREFKGELFQRGILFTAKDLDVSFEQISTKEGFLVRCTVRTKFEAQRGRERFDLGESLGAGCNLSDDLALSTAQTMAYKAMLKRSSMTYGEADDAESKKKPTTPPGETMTPKESVRVASYQKRALDAALRDSGISSEVLSEELSKTLGFAISCDEIANLPRKEFDHAMKLILGRQDLTASWSANVEYINAKKAQPVVELLDKSGDIA